VRRPVVLPDPRRPGHNLALTTCWCTRTFTLTAEEIATRLAAEVNPDPCPDRGAHAVRATEQIRARALQAVA
jgi:hypothetical protein